MDRPQSREESRRAAGISGRKDGLAGRQAAGLNVKCWHYKHKYQLQFSYSQPQDYNLILTGEPALKLRLEVVRWMKRGESGGRDLQLKNNLSQNLITKRRTRRGGCDFNCLANSYSFAVCPSTLSSLSCSLHLAHKYIDRGRRKSRK